MGAAKKSFPELVRFSLVTLAIYFLLQAIIVVLHEHAHSTAAWILGYSSTPFTVVWGNPLTILGWDEGVPYDQLFPSAGYAAEAVIGGAPLLMHAVFVALGFHTMRRLSSSRKLTFYAVYLFVVVNLTELVAYIFMRPFAGSGDTGRFNEGFGLTPWPLFLAGTVFLCLGLGILLRRTTPRLDRVMEWSRTEHTIVIYFTAFVMFLWGSGLRVMALYPDRQWKWGLIGIAGFVTWPFLSPRYLQDR